MSRIHEPEGARGEIETRFFPGETVCHKRFGYRGVVVDVDPNFQLSDDWYDQMARSRPPKDRPWYHVLVNEATHMTYVAERNLEPDVTGEPIRHPLLGDFFDTFEGGRYLRSQPIN